MPTFNWKANHCRIMGVVNVTPDSFSDGGDFLDPGRAVEEALTMISEGAELIDIGGESTRPGSESVPSAIQIERVVPVIRELSRQTSTALSIDTTRGDVAQAALDAGATVVNDTSAGREDSHLITIVARTGAPVVLMHRSAAPRVMQEHTAYNDVVADSLQELQTDLARFLDVGCRADQIAFDPGIGFGKTVEQNLEIINRLGEFAQTGQALVFGASRKSFLGKITDVPNPKERLASSLTVALEASRRGADWVRVHDVAETYQALTMERTLREAQAMKGMSV